MFFLMDSFRNPIKLHFRDPMKLHCPILDQNLCGCLFFPSLEWNRISWQLGHFQRERKREMGEGRSLSLTPTWSVTMVMTVMVDICFVVERSIYRFGNIWNDEI